MLRIAAIFVFLMPIALFSQSEEMIYDTIYTVAYNKVKLFDKGELWNNLKVSVDIFNNDTKVGSADSINIHSRKTKSFLKIYLVYILVHFDSPGEYKVIRTFSGTNQPAKNAIWPVKVDWPKLTPQLDSFYYYSEKGFFNFTASGLGDYSLYSYKIEVDGKDVDSSSGPIVILDNLTNKLNYVGKTIKIKGFYNGREFRYYNPTTKSIETSIWSVPIKAPDKSYLESYGDWTEGTFKEGIVVLNMSGGADVNTIKFSYLVLKNDSYIIIPPKIDNLTVESVPDNILSTKHPQVAYGKIWSSFVVEPNQTFLSSLQGLRNISLSISFTDQFREIHRRNFTATVYYKK